jgi:hypothetical protein
MIKKICLFAIFILSLLEVDAQITAFDFNGITTVVTTANATTTIANTTPSVISRGAGVTATSLSNAFAGSGWDATSLAAAITGNDYFEFTIATSTNFNVSLSVIVPSPLSWPVYKASSEEASIENIHFVISLYFFNEFISFCNISGTI